MKKVQTTLSDTEYSRLEAYAKSHGKTIEDAVREAIRRLILPDTMDPGSSMFKLFPLTRKQGRYTDAAERHDFYLYGWDK